MKKLLLLFTLLIIPVGIYAYPESRSYLAYKLSYSLCDSPIHYRIDTVDPKFNLSRDEFISDVNQAAKLWEIPIGKNLFISGSKAELSVNLIFDERQSLTNQINQLESQVQTNKLDLAPQVNEYKNQSLQFEAKLQAFKKEVEEWNSKGGAPEDVYNKLSRQQKDLQAEASRLNEMARSLNISTRNYNSQVGQLNQTIRTFNQDLTSRPEEGIFKGPENRIEIYFDISHQELVHTLAHELGHALGLDHISNPKAIMYYKTNQIIQASDDDIAALNYLCRRHSILEILQNYISHLRLRLAVGN